MTDFQALLVAANTAKDNAYAPYSKLHVGAAVLSASGKIYAGCNVENAAYPLGGCAEHHAIAAAVLAEGPQLKIEAVAIVARDQQGQSVAIPPCGGCRQKIREFGPMAKVHFLGPKGTTMTQSLSELLPASFSLETP